MTYVQNTGTAFGFFQGNNRALGLLAFIILVALLYGARGLTERGGFWGAIGVAFVLGGAVGNMIDRFHYGRVIDFIDFRFWPVFNVADSAITDDQDLAALAAPYGSAAAGLARFWQLTTRGMELFPWDVAWYVRQIGRSRVDHALSAARIRGMPCCTPSWCSTRATIFLRSYEYYTEDDPWLREDIELRSRLAAEAWAEALTLGEQTLPSVPDSLRLSFQRNLLDLGRLRRRAAAYALHLRETNLAQMLREYPAAPARVLAELRQCLQADLANYAAEQQAEAAAPALGLFHLNPQAAAGQPWTEAEDALRLLDSDPAAFLQTYLTAAPVKQVGPNPQPGYNPLLTEKLAAKGLFSVTSR
jgi:hypothetical protein